MTGASTLEALGALAPVVGVRGDHDRADLGLPGRQVITIAGHRVGLLHGNRSHLVEEPITFVGTVTLGFAWVFPGLNAWLRRQFADVDVVIHGHTHRARVTWYREVLLFNPGGVYQIGPETCRQRLSRNPGWFEWCWLQVAQFIRLEYRPTVGLLELGPEEMRASIVSL